MKAIKFQALSINFKILAAIITIAVTTTVVGVSANQANSQKPNVTTLSQANPEAEQDNIDDPSVKVATTKTASNSDNNARSVATGDGTTPMTTTEEVATNTLPHQTQQEAPVQPVVPVSPEPTRTGERHIRFVDISPATKPNSKADQYCDYRLSDGSTDSVWAGSITYNFKQPIAGYNENNLPGLYSGC